MYKSEVRQPVLFKEMKCLEFNKKKEEEKKNSTFQNWLVVFRNNPDPKN